MSGWGVALVLALGIGGGGAAVAMSVAALPGHEDGGAGGAVSARAENGGSLAQAQENDGPPYNGQFTYVRIRFGDSGSDLRNMGNRGSGRRGRGRGGGTPWSHDWPRAETNFAKILNATTFIDNYMSGSAGRVLTLDDPELFKYPVATIIEVGYWNPSDSEVANLRAYLLKGGFLIVDDFREGRSLQNLAFQLRRVLPEYQIDYVPEDHEIFNSFFNIADPYSLPQPYGYGSPRYLGIFEDNDPANGRIMVMINYNQDFQEYWEFSDQGYYPIDLSNEAYKFGVNYLIYSFTH
jgi:hypothetical protein